MASSDLIRKVKMIPEESFEEIAYELDVKNAIKNQIPGTEGMSGMTYPYLILAAVINYKYTLFKKNEYYPNSSIIEDIFFSMCIDELPSEVNRRKYTTSEIKTIPGDLVEWLNFYWGYYMKSDPSFYENDMFRLFRMMVWLNFWIGVEKFDVVGTLRNQELITDIIDFSYDENENSIYAIGQSDLIKVSNEEKTLLLYTVDYNTPVKHIIYRNNKLYKVYNDCIYISDLQGNILDIIGSDILSSGVCRFDSYGRIYTHNYLQISISDDLKNPVPIVNFQNNESMDTTIGNFHLDSNGNLIVILSIGLENDDVVRSTKIVKYDLSTNTIVTLFDKLDERYPDYYSSALGKNDKLIIFLHNFDDTDYNGITNIIAYEINLRHENPQLEFLFNLYDTDNLNIMKSDIGPIQYTGLESGILTPDINSDMVIDIDGHLLFQIGNNLYKILLFLYEDDRMIKSAV